MTAYRNLRLDITGPIATVTIDRPAVRNAMDAETASEFMAAIRNLDEDSTVGALIITGAGSQTFGAGADLRQMREWGIDEGLLGIRSRLFTTVERFAKPTIAAVNGAALGGGCELALACDVRIAVEHAKFGQPEVSLGVIPAAGGTQRLPRIIGLGRATHMVLTGDPIDAATALSWGLVSAVVPARELMTAAKRLAEHMLSRSPLALRLAKVALRASARVDVDSGLVVETLAQTICFQSGEKNEGTTAFLEKRAPRFRRPTE